MGEEHRGGGQAERQAHPDADRAPADGDVGLFLVPRGARGLSVTPAPTMGLRGAALADVKLEGVRLADDALLGGDVSTERYEALVDRARIGWGALAVGTGAALLDYVIEYCNDRVAFGEPISHRQAVAFTIANIAIEVEGLRLLVYRAASRADHGLPFREHAHHVRAFAGDKAMQIGTDGVQLLGGAGFIRDHPVERWYRHLRGVALMEGALIC